MVMLLVEGVEFDRGYCKKPPIIHSDISSPAPPFPLAEHDSLDLTPAQHCFSVAPIPPCTPAFATPLLPLIYHKIREPILLQQFNVQADGAHEQIDIRQPLSRHVGRQGLSKANCVHDTVLDCQHEPLLLLGAGADADRGEKLPDIDVLGRVDGTGEDVGQRWLEDVEELSIGGVPGAVVSDTSHSNGIKMSGHTKPATSVGYLHLHA